MVDFLNKRLKKKKIVIMYCLRLVIFNAFANLRTFLIYFFNLQKYKSCSYCHGIHYELLFCVHKIIFFCYL